MGRAVDAASRDQGARSPVLRAGGVAVMTPEEMQRARDVVALIKRWPGRTAWALGSVRHSVEVDGSIVLFEDSANAAFMIGAYEMMPPMLAEIERLRERVAELEDAALDDAYERDRWIE